MGDRIHLNRSSVPLLPFQLQAKRKGPGAKTWLIVSKLGKSSVEELGKQMVMRRTGLTAHDMRVIEPELSYPSAILRRERATVVNLEHIKAIITANEVLVPNPRDPRIASFVSDLKLKLSDSGATTRSNNVTEQLPSDMPLEGGDSRRKEPTENSKKENSKPLPFEFRALEICLESVCRSLESETSTLEEEAYPALDQLSAKTSTNNLKRVRVIKGRLVALTGSVQKVRNEFEHLLDDDDDMAQMYLTDKLAAIQSEGRVPEDELYNDADAVEPGDDIIEDMSKKCSTVAVSDLKPNVEELEMLLGAYFVQIEGILNKLSTLHEYVCNTEDYINIVLDDKQNQLLRMGVFISTATLMITSGVVATGFLSINVGIHLFGFGTYKQWYLAAGGCCAAPVVLYIIAVLSFKIAGLLG